MFDLLMFISAIFTTKEIVKEYYDKKNINHNAISDFDIYRQDVLSGLSHEKRMDKMSANIYHETEHPEPHRYNGNIIIENCQLFESDKAAYGIEQVYKWAAQGKYNLSEEEQIVEKQRIDDKYELLYSLVRKDNN